MPCCSPSRAFFGSCGSKSQAWWTEKSFSDRIGPGPSFSSRGRSRLPSGTSLAQVPLGKRDLSRILHMTNAMFSHPEAYLLEDFGLGRLDDSQAAEIEQHVAGCDRCRRVVEDLPADPLMQMLQSSYTEPGTAALWKKEPAAE